MDTRKYIATKFKSLVKDDDPFKNDPDRDMDTLVEMVVICTQDDPSKENIDKLLENLDSWARQ